MTHSTKQKGVTLIELIIAMAFASILVLVVGILLLSSQNMWFKIKGSTQKKIYEDARAAATTFTTTGRKSNRYEYILYKNQNGQYSPALPLTSDPEEVVYGDAVEFRYWNVELDMTDSHNLLDNNKTSTAYALFYIEDDTLKVNFGPYPQGGIDAGGSISMSGVTTRILAENVSTDLYTGPFSHTTVKGNGQGSVRIHLTLTDPSDQESVELITATMQRNLWPR